MKDKIQNIAQEFINGSSSFLVEVKEKSDRIVVVLDGYNGVDIRMCSRLSRHINRIAEEDAEIAKYGIEVTSVGIGADINNVKQLKANVGRLVSLKKQNSEELQGRLIGADDEFVFLIKEKQLIPYKQADIKSIKVEIEF